MPIRLSGVQEMFFTPFLMYSGYRNCFTLHWNVQFSGDFQTKNVQTVLQAVEMLSAQFYH
jgi:hypothetical protein